MTRWEMREGVTVCDSLCVCRCMRVCEGEKGKGVRVFLVIYKKGGVARPATWNECLFVFFFLKENPCLCVKKQLFSNLHNIKRDCFSLSIL